MRNFKILAIAAVFAVTAASAKTQVLDGKLNPDGSLNPDTSEPQTGYIDALPRCGGGLLAFDKECRDLAFFEALVADGWDLLRITGCNIQSAPCEKVVVLSEVDGAGRVRTLFLTTPQRIRDTVSPDSALIDTSRSTEADATRPQAESGDGRTVRRRGNYPITLRVTQELNDTESALSMAARVTVFDPPGRNGALVEDSTLSMGAVSVVSSAWTMPVEAEFCSEDGQWSFAETAGLEPSCASPGAECSYSGLLCDAAADEGSGPTVGGRLIRALNRQIADSGGELIEITQDRDCSASSAPTLFMDFGPASTSDNGLSCRSGSGAVSFSTPQASGAASGIKPMSCGIVHDVATGYFNGVCHKANAIYSKNLATGETILNQTYGVGAGVTVDIVPAEALEGFWDVFNKSSEWDDWLNQQLCPVYWGFAGDKIGKLQGCAGGACTGTQENVPVEAVAAFTDGPDLVCDATADVTCEATGDRTGTQIGDVDCDCEVDETSVEVDEDSCRLEYR